MFKRKDNDIILEDNYIFANLTGGLGNQLFIIATAFAYSLKYKKRLLFSDRWKDIKKDRPSYWNNLLKNLKKFTSKTPNKNYTLIKEKDFEYNELQKCNGNCMLEGYFQSDKYFKEYTREIKELFKIPDTIGKTIVEKYSKFKNDITVMVHIRRGDYLKLSDFHYLQDINYYTEAKSIIESKLRLRPTYLYFSDDKEWVKDNFKLENKDEIISLDTDYEEFCMMQKCNHFIIQNSSFSWWSAWLGAAEDSIVVCPSKWFGPKGPQNWQDIYSEKWIQLDDFKDNYFLGISGENRINITHKFWRDDIIINEDMTFHRHLHPNETGHIFLNDKVNLLWNNYEPEIINKITDKAYQNKSIYNRINSITFNNKYDLYLINLEHRKDRLDFFLENIKEFPFNVKKFNAVKHHKGSIGCALSHLSLINYAKENKLPYIIIAEDDSFIKITSSEVLKLLDILTHNVDKWEIFNGSPSLWDKKDSLDEIMTKDFLNDFLEINWGQATSFIIYSEKSYDKMLSFKFNEHIDQFIAKNFKQIILKNKPFSIQKASYSDIGKNSPSFEYENFFIDQYNIINKIKPINISAIGIYSIFIGDYSILYENFIKNAEEKFFPNFTKYYYIVTDKDLPIYNDRTFIINTEKIGWPYETLYRFIYFLQFNEIDVRKSDYMFFINSNGIFKDKIYTNLISKDYIFTYHRGFFGKKYKDLAYEKNEISTAYIPYNLKEVYEYFAGGFYGAKTEKYIEMSKILSDKIFEDEKKGYIATWHDESHLNHFCRELKLQKVDFGKFDILYHIPEEFINDYPNAKLMYCDKKKVNVNNNIIDSMKTRENKVVPNKYNKL